MAAYYNEIDKYAAQWLRNLIRENLIAPGDVDERSIVDVRADDVRGYTQCHWFAGIAGWSLALRLAGFPDDRPVWIGSCPCQPFSAAGKGKAADDSRHLWPAWFPLIAKCRPPTVFGEQVEAAIGWGWLDAIFADLEQEGYACGAAVLPACSVGAPHIRQRVWFVAQSERERLRSAGPGSVETASQGMQGADGQRERLWADSGAGDVAMGLLAHPNEPRRGLERSGWLLDGERPALRDDADGRGSGGLVDPESEQEGFPGRAWESRGTAGELGNAQYRGCEAWQPFGQGADATMPSGAYGFWYPCDWLPCTDGKARPVEPGSFPLAHGVPRRAPKLRAYGNAIVPQVAAEFIKATI
jgi:DNA (cytosine-5)-methyltransferase 1